MIHFSRRFARYMALAIACGPGLALHAQTVSNPAPPAPASPPAAPAATTRTTTATASFWGTGFVVGEGYVLTAHHVVNGRTGLLVGPDAANRWTPAEIVQSDAALDLALLKARINAPVLTLASTPQIPTGLEVSVMGYPQPKIQGFGQKITSGLINGYRNESQNAQDLGLFQFSAEVARGNSGGPVFAPDGTVIGLVQRKVDAKKVAEQTEDVLVNVNYALRSSQIIRFLQGSPVSPRVQNLSLATVLRPYQLYEQSRASVLAILGRKPADKPDSDNREP